MQIKHDGFEGELRRIVILVDDAPEKKAARNSHEHLAKLYSRISTAFVAAHRAEMFEQGLMRKGPGVRIKPPEDLPDPEKKE